MESRQGVMTRRLTEIGFDPASVRIEYHPINPFNDRRNTWIIRAQKPIVALEDDAEA